MTTRGRIVVAIVVVVGASLDIKVRLVLSGVTQLGKVADVAPLPFQAFADTWA